MNPVLKYRGGKSREIPRFLQYIPDDFNRYIEPFLGGGAVYFYLEPENAIINDVNTRLMTFYRQLRDNYPEMRTQLDALQQLYEENQARYKKLKAQAPDERVPMIMKHYIIASENFSIIPMVVILMVCCISL